MESVKVASTLDILKHGKRFHATVLFDTDRVATSPDLFSRCVLDCFGDWSDSAFFQVGREFTIKMNLDHTSYQVPDYFPVACPNLSIPPVRGKH